MTNLLRYVKRTKLYAPNIRKVVVPVKKRVIIPVKKTIYLPAQSSYSVPHQSTYNISQFYPSAFTPTTIPYSTQTEIDNEMEDSAIPLSQNNEPPQVQTFSSFQSNVSQVSIIPPISQLAIPQVPTVSQSVSPIPTVSQPLSQIPTIPQSIAQVQSNFSTSSNYTLNQSSSSMGRLISQNIYNPRTYNARSLSSRRII